MMIYAFHLSSFAIYLIFFQTVIYCGTVIKIMVLGGCNCLVSS